MAIFGTSTGGGMTLAMILRAKQENLPLPAAIAPGTPWSDLTETGDTYKTNEWLDNVLVSYDGYLVHAAKLYANGSDMKDPQLSPIYGDFTGVPPAILTSGTRDLFLSLTVLTHRKLRRQASRPNFRSTRACRTPNIFSTLTHPRLRKPSPRSRASSISISTNRAHRQGRGSPSFASASRSYVQP
jgi:acetyl esterase/lipase